MSARFRGHLLAIVVSSFLVIGARSAGASEEERATQLFSEGEAAFGAGNFRAAALAFEAADRVVPHASVLYNAGRAWEAAKEPDRAANAYAKALEHGLSPPQSDSAEQRLASLREELVLVRIEAPAGARLRLASVENAEPPASIHLLPDIPHELAVRYADGGDDRRTLRGVAGERLTVVVAPPKSASEADRASAEPFEETTTHPGIIAGGVLLGLSLVGTGLAIALGVETLDRREAFRASGRQSQELHDEAVTLRTWTNVAWIAAGVSAAAGTVSLVVGATSEPRVAVRVTPTSLELRGHF